MTTTRPWLLALLLGAAITLAGCASSRQGTSAPSFELQSQSGQIISLASLRGRSVLLTFLYTHCPDTCPLELAQIASSLRAIEQAKEDLPVVVVITVDPERDTGAALREFARTWPSDWLFLTGTPRQASRVWKSYGINVQKRPPPHSSEVHDGYAIVHNRKLIVVDQTGVVREELAGSWTSQELMAALRDESGQPTVLVRELLGRLGDLLRKCGELAAAQPGIALGVLAVLILPGVIVPLWLVRALLRARHTET